MGRPVRECENHVGENGKRDVYKRQPPVCSADSPLKEGACPYGKPPSLREVSSECETKGVLFSKNH